MPEVTASAVTGRLRAALDAQGRVQEAARAAAEAAARKPEPTPPPAPGQDAKR